MYEIGSDFFLSAATLDECAREARARSYDPTDAEGRVLLSTGRQAMALCLSALVESDRPRTALLPAYTCDSVIAPFEAAGFRLRFYGCDDMFRVRVSEWNRILAQAPIDVLLFHPYFGYDTVVQDEPLNKGRTRIICDMTHGFFSGLRYAFADAVVCSLRKWGPLPDGAFAERRDGRFEVPASLSEDDVLMGLVRDAYTRKHAWIERGEGEKADFRARYADIRAHHQTRDGLWRMADVSRVLLDDWRTTGEWVTWSKQRRANYRYLYENIPWNDNLSPYFPPGDETPLYFPFAVANGRRADLQRALAERRVYCPVIWPRPVRTEGHDPGSSTCRLYRECLCFPIDQRYNIQDMEFLVSMVREVTLNV